MFSRRRFTFLLLLLAAVCLLPRSSRADDFDKLDINQDDRLSGTEISDELRPLDTDQDGRVSRSEYLAGTKPTKDAAEKQFQERDVNQDGVLSGTERAGVENSDRNADGEISKQEFLGELPAAGSSRAALFKKSFELFQELDITDDFVLSGTELKTVADYDLNSDGSVPSDEFFEGYEIAQGLGWKQIELDEGKLQVKLPATPEQSAIAGPLKLHAVTEMDDPAIRFEVRLSEFDADIEAQAAKFFTAVQDRLKTVNQMQVLDDRDAPFGDHPGRGLVLQGTQNDFHALRIVLIGKRIYELEAIYLQKPDDLGRQYGRRFLGSLTIDGDSGVAAPSVPAPRSVATPTDLPPAPPPAPVLDPDVPPAPIVAPAPVAAPSSTSDDVPPPPGATSASDSSPSGLFGRFLRNRGAAPPAAPSLPVDPSVPDAPAAPVAPAPLVAPSQPGGQATPPAANDQAKGGPPNGKYNLRKISVGSLIGLGTLEIRDGKYRWGDEGEFAPYTVDAQGLIHWSAGLVFLPDDWKHESSKYVGLDESGRPMMQIYYRSSRGARDLIDAVVE